MPRPGANSAPPGALSLQSQFQKEVWEQHVRKELYQRLRPVRYFFRRRGARRTHRQGRVSVTTSEDAAARTLCRAGVGTLEMAGVNLGSLHCAALQVDSCGLGPKQRQDYCARLPRQMFLGLAGGRLGL